MLSSGLNGQITPNKKAKIGIGLGVPNLMQISSVNPLGEIFETNGSIDYSETMVCAVRLPKGYLSRDLYRKSEFCIEDKKTIMLFKPIASQQFQALCSQI